MIWQYNFYPTDPYNQQGSLTAPLTYWLAVSAGTNTAAFGWKSTTNQWNDASVFGHVAPDGITAIAFGDLFLEDIRRYREDRLSGSGLVPMFPIWGVATAELPRTMVRAGLRARLTCVDPKQLDSRFVGRDFDETLLAELPPSVDPCGERGEFHTFAYAGPMFSAPLDIRSGEIVERDGFAFADLLPAHSG